MGTCSFLHRIVRNGGRNRFLFHPGSEDGRCADHCRGCARGRHRGFTASAVVLQPITGLAMVRLAGFPLSLPWLRWSIALYVLIGCCWLPVVWLQVRMRNLAARAMRQRHLRRRAFHRSYNESQVSHRIGSRNGRLGAQCGLAGQMKPGIARGDASIDSSRG